jgi:hypothetical protein
MGHSPGARFRALLAWVAFISFFLGGTPPASYAVNVANAQLTPLTQGSLTSGFGALWISPIGLSTPGVTVANNGAPFGPDTKVGGVLTKTGGWQECHATSVAMGGLPFGGLPGLHLWHVPVNVIPGSVWNHRSCGRNVTMIHAAADFSGQDQNGNSTMLATDHSSDTQGWKHEGADMSASGQALLAVADWTTPEGSHYWNPKEAQFNGTNTCTYAAIWTGNEDLRLDFIDHHNADWYWDAHAGKGTLSNCSHNSVAHLQHQSFKVRDGSSQGQYSLENAHAGAQLPTYAFDNHTINPGGTYIVKSNTAVPHVVNWYEGRCELDPNVGITQYIFQDSVGPLLVTVTQTAIVIVPPAAGTVQTHHLLQGGSTYVRIGTNLTSAGVGVINDNPGTHVP